MATLLLSSHKAQLVDGAVQIQLFAPGPLAKRKVEVANTLAAHLALLSYKMEGEALGVPMVVCMDVVKGRAPNGFKVAVAKQPFVPVNLS